MHFLSVKWLSSLAGKYNYSVLNILSLKHMLMELSMWLVGLLHRKKGKIKISNFSPRRKLLIRKLGIK